MAEDVVGHWSDLRVGYADKDCCEDQFAVVHKALEKEKRHWLLTAKIPCDYESELF